MKGLIEDDIKQDQETKLYYIKKNRQKTGVEFFSILLGSAVEIITKYEFKLPVPTNQKMNAYLKEIADLCNIDKEITTHMGRHTYGTLLLSNGFGIEMVAKCLGHDPSDTKITARYAKIFDTSLLEKGEKLQAKLMKKAIDRIIKG
jgi:site-specific recombinase XerD